MPPKRKAASKPQPTAKREVKLENEAKEITGQITDDDEEDLEEEVKYDSDSEYEVKPEMDDDEDQSNPDLKPDIDSDYDQKPKRARKSQSQPKSKTKTNSTRKPRTSTVGKKWTGAELEALFTAALAGPTSRGRFKTAVDGRTSQQCYMTWSGHTIQPAIIKFLHERSE